MKLGLMALLICGVLAVQDSECGKCRAKLKPDAKFCTECGEKVPALECAGCKAALKPGAQFCTSCGQKVGQEAPKPPPEPPPKQPVGQDTDPEKVKETRGQELEKFGVTADQINAAIDRGAQFLIKLHSKSEDFYDDEDYLTCYALIHTKYYHSDAKLRGKVNRFLRSDVWTKMGHRIYTVGLRALALEATRDPDLQALTEECAQYLIEAQGPKGTWTYSEKVKFEPKGEAKPKEESAISVAGGEPLDEEPKGIELKKKGLLEGKANDGDNSCTQFGVLGLHAAAKCGFHVPREVWEKCLKEMDERFGDKGGWDYRGGGSPYGSMTCAGICTAALCRHYLGEKNFLENAKIKTGLQWLAENFKVAENPKSSGWPLYYLYSVERVGVFCSTEKIGEHAWYPLGAKHLVGSQQKDGAWQTTNENKEVGTGLALLFLTRATAPMKNIKRGGPGALETHALNDYQNFMFILDASGSMREEMDGKEKFDIAKDVIEGIVTKLPEGTHVGLRVYGHRYTSLDEKSETDSELVVPVQPLNPAKFVATVKALKCKGKTPITHSLNETIRDLSNVPGDVDIVAILLTDGGESTRGAKPDEAAAKLVASRKGMKLHVVGFDINADDWKEQLEKVADMGGGRYFHATKASELQNALTFATVGQADYSIKDKTGKEVHKGKLGDRVPLPEGKYTMAITVDGKTSEKTFWINTDATSHVTVRLGLLMKK